MSSKRKKKARLGRPPLPDGRVPLNTTVAPHIKSWLLANGGASVKITELVEAAMAQEQEAADDYDARQADNQSSEQRK